MKEGLDKISFAVRRVSAQLRLPPPAVIEFAILTGHCTGVAMVAAREFDGDAQALKAAMLNEMGRLLQTDIDPGARAGLEALVLLIQTKDQRP